ncbi:class I SAM-dependent methyltransferase [Aliarcobacter cryaerophilus]|uniref:class I SAM-dependent methyltransferase n=1 Tax=Aliarcobacter cryaerophilus TaxID=28198 RepID=UPI001C641DA1|nr:class I SAM-dependent methyltransferase [Aliarcobacter cryaerophilus]
MIDEKAKQENFEWARSKFHTEYNAVLGYYKILDCLEHSKGSNVLDLACGDGTLTAMIKNNFKRVVGVDASSKHLAIAKQNLPDVEFHECLIEDFETDEKFDTVLMLEILEHVEDSKLILKKAASFLKDDGVLIVHVPNAEAVNRKIAVLMGTLESCEELSPFDINIVGHRRSYTMKTFIKDIEDADLVVKKTGGIFYKMLSTAQMDWFLKNGLWEEGGFGWGRVGAEKSKDWKAEFCRASYEYGKENPTDCNIIYAVIQKKQKEM